MPTRKRALLIGVSYYGTDMELKGTKNDTIRLRQKLIDRFGYRSEDVVLLVEHEGYKPPTGKNILNALIKLIIATRRGLVDECFVSFSGHGSSIPDKDGGDEADGMDEVLVPKDWHTRGVITDDLLSHYFRYFSSKCRVICSLDCCHSASPISLSCCSCARK